jgi:hypothetical protein
MMGRFAVVLRKLLKRWLDRGRAIVMRIGMTRLTIGMITGKGRENFETWD